MSQDAPKSYALRLTPRASADIDAAYARLAALEGEKLAYEWKAGLLEAVAPLAVMPQRQIAPEQSRFKQ